LLGAPVSRPIINKPGNIPTAGIIVDLFSSHQALIYIIFISLLLRKVSIFWNQIYNVREGINIFMIGLLNML